MDGRVFLQRFRFPGRDVDSFVIPTSELQSRPEAEICLPDGEPNGIRIDGPQIKIGLLLALESGYDGYVIDEPYVQALAAPDIKLCFVGYKNVADTLRKLNLDGLLLIGGNFDSPADYYLFPEKLPAGHRLSERSAAYLEAIAFAAGHKLPVLGICAGFQMLAGFFGAKMYTNVTAELGGGLAHKSDKYQDAHTVRLTPGTRLFELCGKKMKLWSIRCIPKALPNWRVVRNLSFLPVRQMVMLKRLKHGRIGLLWGCSGIRNICGIVRRKQRRCLPLCLPLPENIARRK